MLASFEGNVMSIEEACIPVVLLLEEGSGAARLIQDAFRDTRNESVKSYKVQANSYRTKLVQVAAFNDFWLKQNCRRRLKTT